MWEIVNLSNPKTRTYHGRVGSKRPTERSGEFGQDLYQHNYSPRKEKSTVLPKTSKTRRFNVSPEARTSETLFKPTKEQNQLLTSGLPAVYQRFISGLPTVYQRDEKRALFLAAEQWNDAFLSL